MRSKLQVSEERVSKIAQSLEKKKRALKQAEDKLNEAVALGGRNQALAMDVVSSQAEVKALERALAEAEDELKKLQAFEKSEEFEALRKQAKKLEADHGKLFKSVMANAEKSLSSIDDLLEKLVEYDQVNRALGALPSRTFGYMSIKRKAPYSGVLRLRQAIENFLRFVEKF